MPATPGSRLSLKGLSAAAGLLLGLVSVAGFAGGTWWVLDLASHFRVQYLAVALVLAGALALARWYRQALVFAAVAVLNGTVVIPLFLSPSDASPGPAEPWRALVLNVHTANTDHAAVIRSVRAHDPDFFVVEEVNARWIAQLSVLSADYPYAMTRPREDSFGIALYSKHPFASAEIVGFGESPVPSILARFDLDGRAFYLLGTHALPPISSRYARARDAHLADIPRLLETLDAPVLLLGDLNASPWSYPFKHLLRRAGLRDGSRGYGFQPTWPTGVLPLLIPIDHSLYSAGIEVVDKFVGEPVGSDHYPVIVDFVVP